MMRAARTKDARKTSQGQQATVKYSITNSGQMAVGPHSQMNVFHTEGKPPEKQENL